jgi:hypothetical protein
MIVCSFTWFHFQNTGNVEITERIVQHSYITGVSAIGLNDKLIYVLLAELFFWA